MTISQLPICYDSKSCRIRLLLILLKKRAHVTVDDFFIWKFVLDNVKLRRLTTIQQYILISIVTYSGSQSFTLLMYPSQELLHNKLYNTALEITAINAPKCSWQQFPYIDIFSSTHY